MCRTMLHTLTVTAMIALVASAVHAQTWQAPLTVTVSDAVSGESISLGTAETGRVEGAGLLLSANQTGADGPARVLSIDLRDTTGRDRAIDLEIALGADLTGWTWHHDLRRTTPISPVSQLQERRYPLVVATPADGGEGVAMAVEPSQPLIYQMHGSAEGLRLTARLGLTPAGAGDLESRAEARVFLYPVDGRWVFRDALATYYDLFPEAFERRAMAEGQWLFAFQNSDLPNPSHYAYHEGGPTGWEYDEKHGIGTYPYTEVSSRTLHMHRLPEDRQDALAAYDEYRQNRELALADWNLRGGFVDEQVARTGDRSLRCTKDDPEAWRGASQDVEVDQDAPGPIAVSGWLKADGVTGAYARDLSLYADVLLQSGEWEFGEIASFEGGTHDWQQATHVIDLDAPVKTVRLHCLFRHGYTGTVWFDDISVTEGDGPNLALNPSFEETGINQDIAAIDAYHVEAGDGAPVFFIRTDLSADVKPTTPMKLLRFCLNPNPYLQQAEDVELPPGPKAIERYVNMMEQIPALDGAYIDSVSGWASREMDFRRENFDAVRHNFSYDPDSKRVVAPGKYYTYDFLDELGQALRPFDGHVFTNIHNTMNTFALYAVSDVPGIESSITDHERFSYIRSASYQKPAVLLNFLNLHGFDVREKHDHHWRMAVLYGLYPSIGRRCDEAYDLYGDLYRRFMPGLKRISAAGWEPVTYAQADPEGPALERFGTSPEDGLFVTAYNEAPEVYDGDLVLDSEALGIEDGMIICDTTTGWVLPLQVADGVARADMPIRAGDVAVWQIGTPETIANTAREELAQITIDLRRAETEMPDETASRVRDLRAEIIGTTGVTPDALARETVEDLAALYNDATVETTTWTGETPGQALLRAAVLTERARSVDAAPIGMRSRIEAVGGEETRVKLYADGEAVVDHAFLLLAGGGLHLEETDFTWPEEGYGPGLIDVIGLGIGDGQGAVRLTYDLRPALELSLETPDPSAPAAERILTARCHNNSSNLRQMRLRIEAPDDRWALTPAQWRELNIPAGGTAQTEFRVAAPEGTLRMQEMKLVGEAGAQQFETTATALCGGPAQLAENLARAEGVEVSVDSNYSGYSPEALNDGLLWPTDVHWTRHAWASAETAADHWVRFDWDQPQDLQRVIVYWNVEDDRVYTPRSVVVEVEKDGRWMPLGEA
ncbi:MAG: hypothetical protein GF393_06325, partial [Armatimonadia bacterium]|nr:hypothetical protein [Armatimonadia bacterium]